ncbi:hypothetical protein F442_18949 [Phytophthora nicotianae P10297]|uniref:Uncharacterized protein n=2 Tax=Phytophthora nicotianae TaxID=4792 RepID=W2YB97_PHYNI|nr:hypothetical protein L917_18321 [Phytophthora nicotianae]ETP32335.1 hypothetical protein F442_18949 [Phytophthora nicotianae P10297]
MGNALTATIGGLHVGFVVITRTLRLRNGRPRALSSPWSAADQHVIIMAIGHS